MPFGIPPRVSWGLFFMDGWCELVVLLGLKFLSLFHDIRFLLHLGVQKSVWIPLNRVVVWKCVYSESDRALQICMAG